MPSDQNRDANPFQQKDEFYFQPKFDDFDVSSVYIAMRDGVKLATTICIPQGLSPSDKLPTLLYQTRYQRTHHFHHQIQWAGPLLRLWVDPDQQ